MLNMLTIALGGVAAERPTLRVAPSRATHAIYDWLEERERDVYPNMEGYAGAQQVQRDRMTAPTTPARLPEALWLVVPVGPPMAWVWDLWPMFS